MTLLPDDEVLLTVIRRKVKDSADTYMLVHWSLELGQALEKVSDVGQCADRIFEAIEDLENDARRRAEDETLP